MTMMTVGVSGLTPTVIIVLRCRKAGLAVGEHDSARRFVT
jgi:hypothetical protein